MKREGGLEVALEWRLNHPHHLVHHHHHLNHHHPHHHLYHHLHLHHRPFKTCTKHFCIQSKSLGLDQV
jgi:hypothetical protein